MTNDVDKLTALRLDRSSVTSHVVGFLKAWQQAVLPHQSLTMAKPSSELLRCSLAHMQVFTVRALETFFRDCFVLLCQRESDFLAKATEATKGKLDYATLAAFVSGRASLEEHLAAQRNFQNLDVVNLAFEPLFSRPTFDALNEATFRPYLPGNPPRSIPIDLKTQPWKARLYDLVEARHQVIHNSNRPLPSDQESVVKQAETALLVGQLFGSHLAATLGVGTVATEAPLWMVVLTAAATKSELSPVELIARMAKEVAANSELREAKGHIGPAIIFAKHIMKLRFVDGPPSAVTPDHRREVYHLLNKVGDGYELCTLYSLQNEDGSP